MPGRAVDLVAGEDVEIGSRASLHVDREVHRALARRRASTGTPCAWAMRTISLHRRHRAEHVRHVRDRDDLGPRREQLLEFVEEEVAVVVDRHPFDHRALALAQEVPGHDVGMVLHDREDDLVALPDTHACRRSWRRGCSASVADFVNTISSVEPALRKRARPRARPRSLRSRRSPCSAGRDARWRSRSPWCAPWRRSRRAASAPRRRCRDRRAACRRPVATGSGTRARIASTSYGVTNGAFIAVLLLSPLAGRGRVGAVDRVGAAGHRARASTAPHPVAPRPSRPLPQAGRGDQCRASSQPSTASISASRTPSCSTNSTASPRNACSSSALGLRAAAGRGP